MDDPKLIEWEPRWASPHVEASCPSCGLRIVRHASSWTQRGDVLHARFRCDFTSPVWADRDCYRVFDAEVPL